MDTLHQPTPLSIFNFKIYRLILTSLTALKNHFSIVVIISILHY